MYIVEDQRSHAAGDVQHGDVGLVLLGQAGQDVPDQVGVRDRGIGGCQRHGNGLGTGDVCGYRLGGALGEVEELAPQKHLVSHRLASIRSLELEPQL